MSNATSPGLLSVLAEQMDFVVPSPKRLSSSVVSGGSSSRRRHKGKRDRQEAVPLEWLMEAGLVKIGDTLELAGRSCTVLKEGWLEHGPDKTTLDAFIALALKKGGLPPDEKKSLKSSGKAVFQRVLLNGEANLWDISEKYSEIEYKVGEDPSPPKASKVRSQAGDSPLSLERGLLCDEVDEPFEEEVPTQLPQGDGGDLLDRVLAVKYSQESAFAKRRTSLSQETSSAKPKASSNRTKTKQRRTSEVIVLDVSSDDFKSTPVSRKPWERRSSQPAKREIDLTKRPLADEFAMPESMAVEVEEARREVERGAEVIANHLPKKLPRVKNVWRKPKEDSKRAEMVEPPPKAEPDEKKEGDDEELVVVLAPQGVEKMENSKSLVKSPVLLCSGLKSAQLSSCSHACDTLGGAMLEQWNHDITHVVVKVEESSGKCSRTLKYGLGVLAGAFIVSLAWIQASVKAGQWVDEEPFLVEDNCNVGQNAPQRSLTRYRQNLAPLFDGYRVFFSGLFAGPVSKGDLVQMARVGGATVLEEQPQPHQVDERVIVIADAELTSVEADEIWRKCGRDPILFVWMFDCVSSLSILPTRFNRRYKRSFHEDVAKGSNLLLQTQNSPGL